MSIFPVGAKIGGDVGDFIGAMAGGTKALGAFAGGAGLATGALGLLAGAAAMGAAIKAAKDYQLELVKLNTLVGISTEQIEAWDDQMRQIAITTGQSARDVAKAMFAITSGGARGQKAIELLEISAKASAIGLGDMTSLGRTAGAMLQGFADVGLTASGAMDVLVATVREGNLEATSLSGAFSRVLGPAKALGSSVQDIGAFMATFTRLGGSTEEAATGLLNVFNLLIKPPDKARAAMEQYGISVERLRGIIREDGLQPALQALVEGLNDNVDAFGEVVPNVRALIGVLNTAGLQSEQYAEVQKSLNNAMGDTETAFETWGDSADATFSRFKSTIGEAGLQIGEALLPPLSALLLALTPIVAAIAKIVDVTDDLVRALGRNANPALDRFFERMLNVPDAVDAATTEIERLNRELEATGFEGNLLTPVQELKKELSTLTDAQLAARVDELRAGVAALTPVTDGYTQSAINARRRQLELADELVVTGAVMQQRIALETELADGIDNTEIVTAGMVATEAERAEAAAELLESLQQEVDLLSKGERGLILHTAALLDDTGALEAEVATRLDSIAALEAEADAVEAAKKLVEDRERDSMRLVEGLESEVEALELTEQAILLKRAAELDETLVLQETVRALLEKRDALQEVTDAEEEAARAVDRASARRERERQTLARARTRAIEQARKAARTAAEDLRLAEIQDDIREVTELSQAWATEVGIALNSLVDDTQNVSEAFADMVTNILKELQRLIIQKAIVEPIAGAILGALSGGFGTSTGVRSGGQLLNIEELGIVGSFTPRTFGGGPSAVGSGLSTSPAPTIIQQTFEFTPSFIDSRDGRRWLRENATEIMTIVARGAQQSGEFARALGGGT